MIIVYRFALQKLLKNRKMVNLIIDNKKIQIAAGTPLIEAARENGIDIPSLCYKKGLPHYSSCMVCMVKDNRTNKYIPSCSAAVEDGMDITASGDDIEALRREAIELLLAEHRAECEAPCKLVCPLGLDIPQMNRLIADNDMRSASELIYDSLVMPEITCSICPGYCEKACRRKMTDSNISIKALIKYVSLTYAPDKPAGKKQTKKIAVYGKNTEAGMITRVLENKGYTVDPSGNIENIRPEFDASVITEPGLNISEKINASDKYLFREGDIAGMNGMYVFYTSEDGDDKEKQDVRKLGRAKRKALAIAAFLETGEIITDNKRFNSTLGKIDETEKKEWLKECREGLQRWDNPDNRTKAAEEASNCLHCDCRAKDDCRLRELAEETGAANPRLKLVSHPVEKKINKSNKLVFENAKCIKCGLCIRISADLTSDTSLCFKGRGSMTIVSEPLTVTFDEILKNGIDDVVNICPTGALKKMEQ